MSQLNLKHLHNGKLTVLQLGKMTISAALYTAYHLQNDEEFTMVTFNMGEHNFSNINILGVPVFFQHDVDSNDLYLIDNIEEELIRASDDTGNTTCVVYVHKSIEGFNEDIRDVSKAITRSDIFEDFFEQVIDDYVEPEVETEYVFEPMIDDEEIEFEDEYDEVEVEFKHIEAFDGKTDIYLDVENKEVSVLLDDIMDLDDEIGMLKEIAQNMLEEAEHISKNGFVEDEDPYLETTLEEDEELGLKFTDEDFEDIDKNYQYYADKEKEFFKTIEDNKEVENMDDKVDNTPTPEFTERLDNMLEYILAQSSVGHDPNYKYEHTTKGGKIPRHKDKYGEFMLENMDNYTIMSSDSHIIELRVKRIDSDTDEVEITTEESELMSDFTLYEVLSEIEVNNKVLKDVDVTLYTVKRKSGEVVWVANPDKK